MQTQQPQRSNHVMARCVDHGLSIHRNLGAANAWVFMRHNAVPAGVITRVLAYPELRRQN
jgi:hypothetical protein